jgi:hypothetical protein
MIDPYSNDAANADKNIGGRYASNLKGKNEGPYGGTPQAASRAERKGSYQDIEVYNSKLATGDGPFLPDVNGQGRR